MASASGEHGRGATQLCGLDALARTANRELRLKGLERHRIQPPDLLLVDQERREVAELVRVAPLHGGEKRARLLLLLVPNHALGLWLVRIAEHVDVGGKAQPLLLLEAREALLFALVEQAVGRHVRRVGRRGLQGVGNLVKRQPALEVLARVDELVHRHLTEEVRNLSKRLDLRARVVKPSQRYAGR